MAPTRQPITFIKKSDSKFMRALALLLRPIVPGFEERFWTTIGHTVYVPRRHDNDRPWGTGEWFIQHAEVIDHESIHVAQAERWGMIVQTLLTVGPSPFLFLIALALLIVSKLAAMIVGVLALLALPLTFGLAWGRWRIEREAYLPSIRVCARRSRVERTERIEFVVETLWSNYAWAWPRSWMREWFRREAP